MDFGDVVARRRMVRRYRPDPVDPGALDRILDAAHRAPSAGFSQGVEMVVVESAAGRDRLAAAAGESDYVARGFEPWLSTAPVHIVIACRPEAYHERYSRPDKLASIPPAQWPAPYWWVDAGATLMLLLLAVANEGLAAGFLGSHAIPELAAAVGFPEGYEAVGLVTIGHERPAPPPAGPARRMRSESEHGERWGVPRRPDSV